MYHFCSQRALPDRLTWCGRLPPSMPAVRIAIATADRRRSLAHRNGTHDGPARPRPRPRRRELHRARHRGAGGAGAGAAPAGHVCRRHRRARAAPSRGRGAGQRHGRGGGRPRHPDRARARRPQPDHRARQWPRHPDRPAPEVPGQERARGHHDHAALGREVRQQGLRDLGRPARRRRLGGQRAGAASWWSRSPATARSTSSAMRAACRWGRWRRPAPPPTGAAPRSASSPTPRSSARRRASSPAILHRMARSKAYLFRGVEIRWRCDPGAARAAARGAGRGELPFPAGPRRLPQGAARTAASWWSTTRSPARRRWSRAARVEWAIAWPIDEEPYAGWYCNTVPTPLGRHPRGGPAHRAAQGPAHPCRADRLQARRRGHRRGRDRRRLPPAVAVPAPAAVPGPDQGAAGLARGDPAGRGRDQGPLRALARQPSGDRHRRARASGAARRGADRAQEGARRRSAARPRPASCACPASSPTARATRARAPRSSSSRAIRPAARPSRRAAARPRPSCRCAARSSTSPRPPPTSSPATRSWPTWSPRSAAAPASTGAPTTCATTRSSS